jgi:eukaryotic-like serine/threonine-protein kinase
MAASYEALLELGHGGMGTVSVARALGEGGFERLVVLKRLHPHLLDEPEAVQRFADEARMAAWVRHANVVSTHQVGSDEQGLFLVLEYIEGASLEELVDRAALKRERIPPPIALRIALDVLAGLQAVHTACDGTGRALQMLHRDVSLQNVLVGRDGVARVADFGIAKSVIGRVKTDRAYVVGKLLYLAPEYLTRRDLGPALDVYSLGVTLWMALSGEELFAGATEAQLITQVVNAGIPPLSSVMQVPPRLDQLVERACSRNPSDRFRSAREMADSIEALARETGWLGSHADVADYVERLTGKDLERRRGLIAERLKDADLPIPNDRQADRAAALGPAARAWPRVALGVGLGAALITAAGFAWRAFSSPAITAPADPAPVTSSSAPPPPVAASPTEPEPVAPAPAPRLEPRIEKRSPRAAPSRTASPVTPPDGISTENPYPR